MSPPPANRVPLATSRRGSVLYIMGDAWWYIEEMVEWLTEDEMLLLGDALSCQPCTDAPGLRHETTEDWATRLGRAYRRSGMPKAAALAAVHYPFPWRWVSEMARW